MDAAVEAGLRVLGVTDHNDVRPGQLARDYAVANSLPILVIPGIEVTTDGGHLLALGMECQIPDGLPLGETVRKIQSVGGLAILPHPEFEHHRVRDDVDAMERHNSRYGTFAVGGSPVAKVANSDAHNTQELLLSRCYTLVSVAELNWAAVAQAIRDGAVTPHMKSD